MSHLHKAAWCAVATLALLLAATLPAAASQLPGVGGIRDQYPLTFDKMKAKLVELLKPSVNPDPAARERENALQKLKAYRFLSGVDYDHLKLDEKMNENCEAGVKLLAKLNILSHNPPNAGLPEDEYQKALKGCKNSNIGMMFPKANLAQSVDMWMFDSDDGNVKMLGHRQWCLSPTLGKTGFGAAGPFSAMWTIDFSHKQAYDTIYYPAKGFQPIEFFGEPMKMFGKPYAWSVLLNPQKYMIPNQNAVDVKIFPINQQGNKIGAALPLNFKSVGSASFGMPVCVIFRPDKSAVAPGKLYLVEITGVALKTGGAAMISYPVEFVTLAAAPK